MLQPETSCVASSLYLNGDWVAVTLDGRFDTNNLESIKGLHWVVPDSPLRPLPLEIFMRDYYEPRLVARILSGERFKPIISLADLNRVQPRVVISRIESQKDNPGLVSITVEVSNVREEFTRDGKKQSVESGAYDLRLFRNGQLVGYMPKTESSDREHKDEQAAWQTATEIRLDQQTGKASLRFDGIKLPRTQNIAKVEFSAYAFNADRVKSQTTRKHFDIPKELTPVKGQVYLISVGVNAYEYPEFDLDFAANDARRIQKIVGEKLSRALEYQEIIQVPLISDYDVKGGKRVVTEETANKGNVKAILDLLSGRKVSPVLAKNIPNPTSSPPL